MSDLSDDLLALARLLDEGKITRSEYDTIKSDLVAEMEDSTGKIVEPSSVSESSDPQPADPKESKEMSNSFLLFIALALSGFLAWLFLGFPTFGTPSDPPAPPARQLAIADTGGPDPDEAVVAVYQEALDRLDGMCVADPGVSHSDYAMRAKNVLADDGSDVSAFTILTALGKAKEAIQSNEMPCSEAYAVVMVLLQE